MPGSNPQILNIAAYKFIKLAEKRLVHLQKELQAFSILNGLKGTILLSPEGINLFLAGTATAIKALWEKLTRCNEFSDLTYKASFSQSQPFGKMVVKIKNEIIPMNDAKVNPARFKGVRIEPRELQRWLDEGREITLLDTRNNYEVDFGTFRNARHLNIRTFRSFPKKIENLEPKAKEETVVIFCTGGIRCEKAAPLMTRIGFKKVYQLDGGILRYFEECGGEHYDGECFVFDERVSLNTDLQETETRQCPRCFKPVTAIEQKSREFVPGVSCPYCDTPKVVAA